MAFLTYLLIIQTKIVVEALEHLYQYFSAFVHSVSSFRLSLPSTSVSRGGGRSLTEVKQKPPAGRGLQHPVRNVKSLVVTYILQLTCLLSAPLAY